MNEREALEHLQAEIAKLREMTAERGLTTLAYLLQMTLVEARALARARGKNTSS